MGLIRIVPLHGVRASRLLFWLLFSLLVFISVRTLNLDIDSLLSGIPYGISLIAEMFPPDFSRWGKIVSMGYETVAMAVWGTFLGILFSIPLGFLSARNTSPNVLVCRLAKSFVNLVRSIPEILYALIFVVSLGMGPLAGVLALTAGTVGLLSKFFAESVESIDPNPVEAIEATGARFLQKISHSVFPMVLPLFNSYNLFLLDRNIRASTVMGIVGAGGIGFELLINTRLFENQKTCTIIIVILITITTVDWISSYLRKRVV
jgi:phosphonate transport system permease protein